MSQLVVSKPWLKFFCFVFFIANCCLFNIAPISAVSDSVDIDVTARCEPHQDVSGVRQIKVSFFGTSSLGRAPELKAMLSIEGSMAPEYSIQTRIGFYRHGWMSALFLAPRFSAQVFCQPLSRTKRFHMAYYPTENLVLAMSRSATFTFTEMDAVGAAEATWVEVQPDPGPYRYKFSTGRDSSNPFWLQVSVPRDLGGGGSRPRTSIKYRFF